MRNNHNNKILPIWPSTISSTNNNYNQLLIIKINKTQIMIHIIYIFTFYCITINIKIESRENKFGYSKKYIKLQPFFCCWIRRNNYKKIKEPNMNINSSDPQIPQLKLKLDPSTFFYLTFFNFSYLFLFYKCVIQTEKWKTNFKLLLSEQRGQKLKIFQRVFI